MKLRMTRAVRKEVERTIGQLPAETGGVLGWRPESGVVSTYVFDRTGNGSATAYEPDHRALTEILKEEWNPAGVRLAGFVHSHPRAYRQPSPADCEYARKFFVAIPDLETFFVVIVMAKPDTGSFELLPYALTRDCDEVVELELEIVPDPQTGLAVEGASAAAEPKDPKGAAEMLVPSGADRLDRVRDAYDLEALARRRIVLAGCGGSAGFARDLARTGLGSFVLIDPDDVRAENIGTQDFRMSDLGMPKVEALAAGIHDINPDAEVIARPQALDDIADASVADLLRDEIGGKGPPEEVLLVGMTDAFAAQARVNRLALQFTKPSLLAGVYREGRGLEITWTHPDVSRACHRCALQSRYEVYAQGFQNDVTSHGCPIFACARVNALAGFVALALLHGPRSHHPRWRRLLECLGARNLIQVRLDPDIDESLGLSVFNRVFAGADQERLVFDEAVFLPQEPDNPDSGFPRCPDCLGTGNLRAVAGTFTDTRVMG